MHGKSVHGQNGVFAGVPGAKLPFKAALLLLVVGDSF